MPYSEADVLAKTEGVCYLCGGPLPAAWQVEHVIPISKGGADVLANVMPACKPCNQRKGVALVTLPDGPLRRALLQTAIVQARLLKVGVPSLSALDGYPRLRPIMAPHMITLRLFLAPGHAHLDTRAIAEIKAGVGHEGARVYVAGAEARVEIPRWPRPLVPLHTMPRRGLAFGVGRDTLNNVVAVDFDLAPHALVAGRSQSGKSTLLQTITWQLAMLGAELAVVDLDGETFAPFEGTAALAMAVASSLEAAHNLLMEVIRRMEARPVNRPDQRPLVVVVDEVHMLPPSTRDLILELARRGRKRRVFVVLATHRPTKDDLPKVLTDQMSYRFAGYLDSAGSRVALTVTGAERLQGAGDMLGYHGGHLVRFQAAMGGPEEWRRLAPGVPGPIPGVEPLPSMERYEKKPNDERVEHLVRRFKETGRRPSQHELNKVFGGSATRNSRARDEANALLASGTY